MKKRGFGVGKWNGVGGKPNPGEEILETAIRESEEEIGVTPIDTRHVAIFKYYFPHDNFGMEVWVFAASEWRGDPVESEEMKPQWFEIGNIPYSEMWSDDEIWMPKVLSGSLLKGSFIFNEEGGVVDHYIEELSPIG